jgi:hypothetical protein
VLSLGAAQKFGRLNRGFDIREWLVRRLGSFLAGLNDVRCELTTNTPNTATRFIAELSEVRISH